MISLVYIPTIVVILFLVTIPNRKYDSTPIPTSYPETRAITIQSKSGYQEDDYIAIKQFIKNKFKQINESDANAISQYLIEFGQKNQLDPKFTAAVIARESAFDKNAVSVTGAKGLGQIKDFNFKSLQISDPFNIKQNISGTSEYLRRMIDNWENQTELAKSITPNQMVTPRDQLDKIKLSLASYYKGFTQINRENGNLDDKTSQYINDILDYYDEIRQKNNGNLPR
jgi:soluble lytic murein transglycosylase-like protein